MNISEFLKLPFTQEFKMLAGKNGAKNAITGVNILDNPRASEWLSPGELILTSGYLFSETPDALEKFITNFHHLNIAAVCIKPQLYLTPLPEELIKLCNQYNLPLIEIPYGISFSKIMTSVMNLLSESSLKVYQNVLDANSTFMRAELEGTSFEKLIRSLEELFDNPLIITGSDWGLVSEKYPSEFAPYVALHNKVAYFDTASLSVLPINMSILNHPIQVNFPDQQSGVIMPLYFNQVNYGYIVLLQKNHFLAGNDYALLEQASIATALKIVHRMEKMHITNRLSRNFYRELIFGQGSIEELHSYEIDFNFEVPYSVFILKVENTTESNSSPLQRKHEEDVILKRILMISKNYELLSSCSIHIFRQGELFIGLFNNTKEERKNKQRTIFQDFFTYLSQSMSTIYSLHLFVGSTQTIERLNQSYKEANQLLHYQGTSPDPIYFSADYYFETFLHQHIGKDHAQEFVSHYLSNLIEYDQDTNSNLVQTLDVFLQYHQNIATASRKLYIHRNTLLYRLEKIESILGLKLADPSVQLPLSLSLKLLRDYEIL